MTSGVRRLTFSRAVVPLEIRFVLMRLRRRRRAPLLQQFSARLGEGRVANHNMRIRIRRARIIHPNHLRPKGGVFRLSACDVHGCSGVDKREKLRSRLPMKPNATVRSRVWMNKSLMESVGRRELTPITHRIPDVTTGAPTRRRNNRVSAHAEAV